MIKNISKNQKLLQTIRIIEDQCIFCFVKSVLKQYPTLKERYACEYCCPGGGGGWSGGEFATSELNTGFLEMFRHPGYKA